MHRLKGWDYARDGQHPGIVGHYTNDIVYARLAPGVLEKLQQLNPVQLEGGRGHRHHQHLTENEGYPMLQQHLAVAIGIMRGSAGWKSFRRSIDRSLPKHDSNLELLFDIDYEEQELD